MAASIISCPIDDITKKKIDIVCGLKKMHQYEFISKAIEDKLKNENVNHILDNIENIEEEDFQSRTGFFGKLKDISEI